MGTTFNSEEWDVTVVNFDPDMTDEVVAEDIVGEEPEDGYIYGVAELELTYTGDGSEDPWFDIELAYVTEDDDEIGRASCRERAWRAGLAGEEAHNQETMSTMGVRVI